MATVSPDTLSRLVRTQQMTAEELLQSLLTNTETLHEYGASLDPAGFSYSSATASADAVVHEMTDGESPAPEESRPNLIYSVEFDKRVALHSGDHDVSFGHMTQYTDEAVLVLTVHSEPNYEYTFEIRMGADNRFTALDFDA